MLDSLFKSAKFLLFSFLLFYCGLVKCSLLFQNNNSEYKYIGLFLSSLGILIFSFLFEHDLWINSIFYIELILMQVIKSNFTTTK